MDERAERIKEAIRKKGISYAELERLTGVSHSALQRYASGKTKKIPIDVIEKIANATGVTARYLMCWDEQEGQKENATDNDDGRKKLFISYNQASQVSSDFTDALLKELDRLSDDELNQVYSFAKFLALRSEKESENKK